MSITKNKDDENVKSGSLYIYDAEQWGKYAYAMDEDKKDEYKYTKVVRYTPSANGQPTKRNADVCPDDASINVHGTFDTKDGYIFTSESGANIFSTNEDAGTFVFTTEAKPIGYTERVWQVNEEGVEEARTFVSAKLINNDLSYTETAGTEKSMSYCYMNDGWNNLFYLDCYAANLNMATYMEEAEKKILGQAYDLGKAITQSYIKPREWVEITGKVVLDFDGTKSEEPYIVSVEGNPDHTFSDKATGNRRFILMNNNCQWWEVEPVAGEDGLFHCTHPLNDTYYYWDAESEEWAEKRYTITWKNGDVVIDTYELPRGAMAEYLGTNPTKPMDAGNTYTFIGWTPALDTVTENATYAAVYDTIPRKYTVTLKSDVEGACSFTGAGAYDYNTTATISATMNPDYQFVGWEHDETLDELSFTTTVTGDLTYTVRTSPAATIIRDGLTAGNYYTICMPKAMTEVEGATFWSIVSRDASQAYIQSEVAPYAAGKPYIFQATATTLTAIYEGEEVATPVANGALRGTFVDMEQAAINAVATGASSPIYLLSNNQLWQVDGRSNNKVLANRAYVVYNEIPVLGAPTPAPGRRVLAMPMGSQVATGVDQVQGDEVQSTKVLINGQMFINRNGKMYDAQGKLVK